MRVGVLGAGAMGEDLIKHLLHCPGVREILAVDLREERLRELGDKFPIRTSGRLEDVLSDKTLPLVFVTSPNHTHKELTLRSLEAGKAVMCEKPIATSLEDALEMVEFAEERNAFLQIGFELRYSKLYTKVKEWIDAGLLGEVVNTHCYYICSEFHRKGSWRTKKSTGGGMFGEKLSHYVDLPRWWIGDKVTEVYSVCAPNVVPYFEVRDNYHTTYKFGNGAVSHLTFAMAPAASFKGDPLTNAVDQQLGDGHHLEYLVYGTKGAAATNVFERTIKRWEFSDGEEGLDCNWVENLTWDSSEDQLYFHNTVDQACDIVRRVAEGEPPKTTARDAYETMKLCFAAERSADTGEVTYLL
ncbi:MAG: Gfo/Idh/MocA family oxidoreductase [Armatimonadetes bacterium]|nr:Gfo/Idh/MocA family oxidoreductase [Armatimonadota bacterium]